MQQFHNVAIIGAESEQSQQLLTLLEQREFPAAQIFPVNINAQDDEDSDEDQEGSLKWQGETLDVAEVDMLNWSEISVAWLLSTDESALDIAEQARQLGCVIIDMVNANVNALSWVHAAINPEQIAEGLTERWLNCPISLAGQLSLLLHIIQQDVELERVEVTAMLSAANKGKPGVDELAGQTARLLNGLPVEPKLFSQQLAFNVLPEEAGEGLNGVSKFEADLNEQCKALLQTPELNLNVSAQHVPVFYGDSLALHLYGTYSLDLLSIKEWLGQHDAFELVEDEIVTPVSNIANNDTVVLSRLRQNPNTESGVNLSLMANNPLSGVVANAAQIAETLIKQYI
ncbi:aspartate-semialdehyde dehydrogenase [Agarivorans sp. Toyoura001]|uniref:Asd/ArgC dimerization domain-containing protein n=1 Tax=Agarivorans sp. Toyoura001 TaxID=2283141 RepID=UPI0010EE96BA|nr:Asd/ArgC dimerization domain-containing protein [Agarivorans sp. Toyoura001]GDY28078.1 aspartate-semialdehyde dehydrogenase [Agarivorans sp. Toyoura001]